MNSHTDSKIVIGTGICNGDCAVRDFLCYEGAYEFSIPRNTASFILIADTSSAFSLQNNIVRPYRFSVYLSTYELHAVIYSTVGDGVIISRPRQYCKTSVQCFGLFRQP